MFSQFRQAVESLAHQDNPSSSDGRSRSPDSAESTLVNLRKSAQRQSAPRPRSASPDPLSTTKSTNDPGLRKTTLEERLRASFTVPEAGLSRSTSPVPVTRHPLSPAFTPPSSATPAQVLDVDPEKDHEHDTPPKPEDATQPDTHPNPDESTEVSTGALSLVQEAPQVANTELEQQDARPSHVVEASSVEHVKVVPDPPITEPSKDDVEALQDRLRLVEQRFADVSTSFKKLQVERRELDGVINELTPLEGSKDVASLREYLVNVNAKIELGQDELQRLNGKLTRQEERSEELQETHRVETALQFDQIEKLRQQLTEAEALITASHSTTVQTEEDNAKRDSTIEQLRAEVTKANETAKEEEEKRVKAISLLKTVRQKLVKAEKERDDALRELNEAREKSTEERERDRAERIILERELGAANTEREKAISGLRAQFDKDIATAQDRAERDVQTVRKQFEADMNLQMTSHSAEIATKKALISSLENTVVDLTSENKSFFEQLELRQAELESSQCHAESLQARNTELQFQLKELQERITLLTDEVSELRGEHEIRSQPSGASAEEISQLVASVEFKYEAKLAELKKTLLTAEKERTEAEATWSHKLTQKTKETEELKRMLQSSVQIREQNEDNTGALKAEIEKLQNEARSQHDRLHELQKHIDASKDAESILQRRLSETAARADDNEKQLEESKSREVQLRTQNKTLREELRKVQNSVAILEKQRNPGAGYWSTREPTDSRTSISSNPDTSLSHPVKNEEEINYEYLRNVILQFLEHKEMRPNLVRVLSTILRFTPQETRRLMSKV